MPRLFSRFASTPGAKKKLHTFSLVAFSFLALLSWWTIATEGATLARTLGAIAATVAAGVEAFNPRRRRLLRRGRQAGDLEAEEPGMPDTGEPDMSCVPYRRKGLYFALTVPFWLVLGAVFVYLWTHSFVLSLVFASLFLGISYFQAYCCAYQDCPYVGGFCPAVIGIMPASLMAKAMYGRGIVKSKRRFDTSASLGVACWVGLVVFPLFWLAKLGAVPAVGYVMCHVVYTLIFGATVCPACAIRDICPGGRLSGRVFRRHAASPE